MRQNSLLLLLVLTVSTTTHHVCHGLASNVIQTWFQQVLNQNSNDVKDNQLQSANQQQRRNQLKEELLQECQRVPVAGSNREAIESIMTELIPLSPIQETAKSPVLQKEWLLQWTTEKEINWFINQKISRQVTQNIGIQQDDDNNTELSLLENCISFQNGGGFFVSGILSIEEDDDNENSNNNNDNNNNSKTKKQQRTYFVFQSATLDLGFSWWPGGPISIPPVGKGWFDTVYLDDELRVDVNSRDDILICTDANN